MRSAMSFPANSKCKYLNVMCSSGMVDIRGCLRLYTGYLSYRHKLLKIFKIRPKWDELCYKHSIASVFN